MRDIAPIPPKIKVQIDKFVHAIDALRLTLTTSMNSLGEQHALAHKEYDDYLAMFGESKEVDGERLYRIKSHDHCHDFDKLKIKLARIHAGLTVVPRNFLVALVSQYDAYLGSLLKTLFYLRPELLEATEYKLTFADLCRFGDLNTAREHVAEKEIESVLRESHVEQFEWLEKKFGLKLRVDLPVWPHFVELTERRNLCVHSDAIVSSQYIETCSKHNISVEELKPGQELKISQAYFQASHRIVLEVGVKLGQVLWRKTIPDQIGTADKALFDLIHMLHVEGRYKSALILAEFADTTLEKRHANEMFRLAFRIQEALSHYLAGRKQECIEVLDGQDWSATSNEFKLSESVLREKFDEAASLVRQIGTNSAYPRKGDYLHLPLFAAFRNTEQFAAVFKEVFGTMEHDQPEIKQLEKIEEEKPIKSGPSDIP